jgi:hypothetical protein
MWDGLLDQGFRIAAIGGSDDHTAGRNESATGSPIGSPTTRVLADQLSETAIIDAVRHGRTMVQLRGPDDPLVDVTMQTAEGGAAQIGDEVDGIAHAKLTIHVTSGDGMFAQVWRNGAMLDPMVAITGDDFTGTFDDTPGAGDFRYRVELINNGNDRIVITSHFYVHAIDAAGGCGCDARQGLAGGIVPVLAILLPLSRRRARRAS